MPCAGEAFDRRRRKGEAKVTRGTPVKGSTRGERHWQQQQQQREVNARLCSWSLVQTCASDHRLTFSFAFRERLLGNKRARETRHLRFERLLSSLGHRMKGSETRVRKREARKRLPCVSDSKGRIEGQTQRQPTCCIAMEAAGRQVGKRWQQVLSQRAE